MIESTLEAGGKKQSRMYACGSVHVRIVGGCVCVNVGVHVHTCVVMEGQRD